VGRNGKVNGEVFAKKIIIQGLIEGSAESDRVEIHAGGRMSGKVTSSELVIEAQAIFEGQSSFKARPKLEVAKKSKKQPKPAEIAAPASSETVNKPKEKTEATA